MDLLNKVLREQTLPVDEWLAANNPIDKAIFVASDTDINTLLSIAEHDDSTAIEMHIDFPVFSDGRGFSLARKLRMQGFEGTLAAVGDVTVDRVAYMQRVGFDAVQLKDSENAELVPSLVKQISNVYQDSSDQQGAIYALYCRD